MGTRSGWRLGFALAALVVACGGTAYAVDPLAKTAYIATVDGGLERSASHSPALAGASAGSLVQRE